MALTRIGGAVKSDRIFNTVADMVASKTLKVGDIVETAGYYVVGDGGGNKGRVVAAATGTADGGSYIDLDTHQFEAIFEGKIYANNFGAKGDGVTNDTTAIANADTYCASSNKNLYFLPTSANTYLTDAINQTATFIGESDEITLKLRSSSVYFLSMDVSGLSLKNLTIDSNNLGTSYNVRVNAADCTIDGCTLVDTGGDAATGSVTLCETRDNASGFKLLNSKLSSGFDLFRVNRGVQNITVKGNEFTGWGGRAVYGLGSSVGTSKYIYIEDNYIHTPVSGSIKYPIALEGATYEIQHVYIRNNKIIGPSLPYDGGTPTTNNATADQISLHGVRFFEVSGNKSLFGGDVGITVSQGSKDGIVCNNIINESDTGGIVVGSAGGSRTDRVYIFGNEIINSGQNRDAAHSATAQVGIWLENTDKCGYSCNNIVDNQGTPTMQYAVRVSDSTNLNRGMNSSTGYGTGYFYESGTNSFIEQDAFVRKFAIPLISQLTIAGGAITVTGTYHRVLTEASAATDDLDTINGGTDGMRLTLRTTSSAFDVVVKNGTGNITLAKTGADITLDVNTKPLELIYDAILGKWLEL